MNAASFDEFGRMTANRGVEAQPPTPAAQGVTLYPYVNPSTEVIDGTNLPKVAVTYDGNGHAASDVRIDPISAAADGTQIWRITHNGVDTHPIHFHLFDVQLLNRVTWDDMIIPANELGWKTRSSRCGPSSADALRGAQCDPAAQSHEAGGRPDRVQQRRPAGQPDDSSPKPARQLRVGVRAYRCHILSHEEMDMMRPVALVLPPPAPSGLAYSVTGSGNKRRIVLIFNDNSINETSFLVQRTADGTNWVDAGTLDSPLGPPNHHELRTFTDPTAGPSAAYLYRVVARNTAGYGNGFPTMTASATWATLGVNLPAAPTSLTATLQVGPQVSLSWTDNVTIETGFVIERSTNRGPFVKIATAPAHNSTGNATYVETTAALQPGAATTYAYRVAALNVAGTSAYATARAAVSMPSLPSAPGNLLATNGQNGSGNSRSVVLNWTDNSADETSFTIQRATNLTFMSGLTTVNVGANVKTFTVTGLSRNISYYFRVRVKEGSFVFSRWANASPLPITTNP